MNIESGFKVVRQDDDGREVYFSAVIHRNGVIYTPGDWVEADEGWGPLSVFEQHCHAEIFIRRQFDSWEGDSRFVRMFSCEFIRSAKKTIWTPFTPNRFRVGDLPAGTALADRVKIIAPVQWSWK